MCLYQHLKKYFMFFHSAAIFLENFLFFNLYMAYLRFRG